MRKFRYSIGFSILGGLLALAGSGCGDNAAECGPGTTIVDGECVPTGDACGDNATFNPETNRCEGYNCAAGTTEVDGECVPDGTVVCGVGTTYNPDTGVCDPDISGCGEGLVESPDGECVRPSDLWDPDVTEPAEPNGFGGTPGQFTLPAEGESVSIGGCIDPGSDSTAEDFDVYVFQAAEPMVLDIKAEGAGGLSAAYLVVPTDDELLADDWVRYGVNLVDETSQRELYVPKAGVYALAVTDSRTLFLDAAGNESACYLATVERKPLPTPTALDAGDPTASGKLGGVVAYSWDPNEGDILFNNLTADSGAALGDIVPVVNGTYRGSAGFNNAGRGFGDPAEVLVGGLADADEVIIYVDPVANFSIEQVDYSLVVDPVGAVELPADGSSVTLTQDDFLLAFTYFDVADGEIVRIEAASAAAPQQSLIIRGLNADLDTIVGEPCAGPCAGFDDWFQFSEPGRYYVGFAVDGLTPGETFEVTATRTHVVPTEVTLGTALTGVALTDQGAWLELDLSASEWVTYAPTLTGFDDDLGLLFYDRAQTGVIGSEVEDFDLFPIANGGEQGRIQVGETRTALIRAVDIAGNDGTEVFDLTVAEQMYTDLGTVDLANPVDMNAVAIGAGESNLYLFEATPGSILEITATGNAGLATTVTTLDEYEEVLDSDTTSLVAFVGLDGWVAFQITGDAAGDYDLDVVQQEPVTYTATTGALSFSSICPTSGGTGDEIDLFATGFFPGDDEGASDPLAITSDFSLFGIPVDSVTLVSNGWMTFAPFQGSPMFNNAPIPTAAAPNLLIAPYWDDLYVTTVCALQEANQLTLEWSALTFEGDEVVEVQVVLRDTGVIDVIYGGAQTALGDGATIGIEDIVGGAGEQFSFNQANAITAGSSITFTPN